MPPKKPSKPNGFYYFMMEFRDKQPRKFGSMAEVSEAAGVHWRKMTDEEKRPYTDRAKTTRNNQKVTKYTTFGQDIAVVQRQQNELAMKEQQMKDDIENTIQRALASGKLPDEVFYFIHINYFCYCISEKRYYPAEIAVAKWSLKDGVTSDNIFSIICKPGSLPLGFASSAIKISKDTHQIPPPTSLDTEYNLDKVAHLLWDFFTDNNSNGKSKLPPVYASKMNLPVVENVLLGFSDEFGLPEFKVYSLEYFFFTLRNNCGVEKVWAALSLSQLELEKDKYDFCGEIACDYHDSSDIPNVCSRSIVVRTVYTICDNCCGDIGIDLIPGRHLPKKANVSAQRSQSRAGSVISSIEGTVNPSSWRLQPLQSDYLSRGETDFSELSEIGSVVDLSDYNAAGGVDSQCNQVDTDEWSFPKQKKKWSSSVNSDHNVNTTSSRTPKQPPRKPTTLSAAITGVAQMSISKESRGRGRGIGANFLSNKK